jgi:hypothetical protein
MEEPAGRVVFAPLFVAEMLAWLNRPLELRTFAVLNVS